MRLAIAFVVVGLVLILTDRAMAEDNCGSFAFEVSAASHAYVDFDAYQNSGDSDDAATSFKVFSHMLDVADEYSQKCPVLGHEDAFKSYNRLNWWRQENNYASAGLADKSDFAKMQSAELDSLWLLGFGKSDTGEYSVMKQTTMKHFTELGLEFRSPETGKVVVHGNPTLANCGKNDHDADFSKVTLAYPSDAAHAKFGGKFDLNFQVDAGGQASDAHANMEDFEKLNDANLMQLSLNVARELEAEIEAATWGAAIKDCKPAQDYLMLTAVLDPPTQTITLTKWQSPLP